ncbi:hypothetical protein TB2_035564 [Malus domestica]
MRNLGEFREAGSQRTKGAQPTDGLLSPSSARRPGQWKKSGFGTIKVNTDAAWRKETLCVGVGWVARDFAGLLQAAGGAREGYYAIVLQQLRRLQSELLWTSVFDMASILWPSNQMLRL